MYCDHIESACESYIARKSRKIVFLKGLSKHHTELQETKAFCREIRQIIAIWVYAEINIPDRRLLPFIFGVGDHRGIFVHVPLQSLIRECLLKIPRPTGFKYGTPNTKLK